MLLRVVEAALVTFEAALVTESGVALSGEASIAASDAATVGRGKGSSAVLLKPSFSSSAATTPFDAERPQGSADGVLQLLQPLPASFASQLRPDGGHDPNSPRGPSRGVDNTPFLASERGASNSGGGRSSSSGGAGGSFTGGMGNGAVSGGNHPQWRQVRVIWDHTPLVY